MGKNIRARTMAFFIANCMVARYKPTQSDNVTQHRFRGRLLDLLHKRPMSSKKALLERSGGSPGNLTHHLRVLETCKLIQRCRSGRCTRFFLTDSDPWEVEAVGLLREKPTLGLAKLVLERPGAKQNDLTSVLGMSRKMARAYLDRLADVGLVQEEVLGRCHHYHPGPSLEQLVHWVEKGETPGDGTGPARARSGRRNAQITDPSARQGVHRSTHDERTFR